MRSIGTFLSRTGAIVTGTPFDNKIEPMVGTMAGPEG